jgi:hypothetical protein
LDEQSIPKKVFTGQMFGKRPIGKPRKRWIDSVEEDSVRFSRRPSTMEGEDKGGEDPFWAAETLLILYSVLS